MSRIQHKVNHGWAPDHTDPEWAEQVEREAEMTTEQAQRAYEAAERRLARAVERAEKAAALAETRAKTRKERERRSVQVARLWRDVELRRQELLALERLVKSSPAGSKSRGVKGHRPVGMGGTL